MSCAIPTPCKTLIKYDKIRILVYLEFGKSIEVMKSFGKVRYFHSILFLVLCHYYCFDKFPLNVAAVNPRTHISGFNSAPMPLCFSSEHKLQTRPYYPDCAPSFIFKI